MNTNKLKVTINVIKYVKKIIASFFEVEAVKGKYQKTFSDLKGIDNKSPLRIDWFCKIKGIKLCVEVNGQQHYNKNHFWHLKNKKYGKNVFINDIKKEEFCRKHNICFIKIPYWETESEIKDNVINRIKCFLDRPVLAFDPGTVNFAFSCIGVKSLKIRKIGMLNNPVSRFNSTSELKQFEAEIYRILYSCYPKYVVIERYQNRGKFTGNQVELVSRMIGFIEACLISYGYAVKCIPALEWKSHFRRTILTDEIVQEVLQKERAKRKNKRKKIKYKFEMEHLIESKTLTEHEIDAIGIALYQIEKLKKKTGLLLKLDDSLIRSKK